MASNAHSSGKLVHLADGLLSHPLMLALFVMDFAMLVFLRSHHILHFLGLICLVIISLFFGQKLRLFRCNGGVENKQFTRL